jgi:Phage capsid family
MEQLDAMKREYNEKREKALAITEKAQAEERSLTDAEMAGIERHVEQAKQLQSKIEQMERGLKAMELVGKASEIHFGTKDGATLGLKGDEQPHPWATSILKQAEMQGVKAFSAPSGSIPLPALSTVPFSLGQLGAPLVQAIGLRGWPAEGGRAVTYLRQTGRTNRAAIWRYGAAADGSDTTAKPTTDLTTVAVEANAETIAHLASPIKRNDLADFPGLQQWVQSELNYGLLQALEAAVLAANGTEPEMVGLLHLAGTTPVSAGADAVATIVAAKTALAGLGYGDGISAAMNPADWEAVVLTKTTQGAYVYAGPPGSNAPPAIFGIPIVPSPNVPAKTAVVSNFRMAVQLYEREGVTVTWGTSQDQIEKNLLTAVCEGRFALTVPQPAAVAVATLP